LCRSIIARGNQADDEHNDGYYRSCDSANELPVLLLWSFFDFVELVASFRTNEVARTHYDFFLILGFLAIICVETNTCAACALSAPC
jgi:hypothetical protein